VSISGRDVPLNLGFARLKKTGFNITYKWIQGFTFEGSPQFTGEVPTYDMVDAQVNATFDKIHTTVKIGASNILNNKVSQTYGGPAIGTMAYASVIYDFVKK
jgi:outer membrane receptor protein involved in Fe transport